jgi:sec-independent protein translocase protein TatC
MKPSDLKTMTLTDHLLELRRRLLLVVVLFGVLSAVGYTQAEALFHILVRPLQTLLSSSPNHRLIYTALPEAFLTYLKVALFFGGFVTCPLALMHLWRFIMPGLYQSERQKWRFYFVATPLLFYGGALFAYTLVIPKAWAFFLSFEVPQGSGVLPIHLEARMGEYLSMTLQMLFAFGLSFLLPIALMIACQTGLVTVEMLARGRRYALLLILIASAILTPPDLFSMIALAIPLYALYESALLFIRMATKRQS